MTQEEEVREVRLAEIRRVLASMPEDFITLNEKFLLSEVDRLSQELDSAKTERGLAFVEVSAWRQKDDSEKRITKERDTALAQVKQLREALLHCKSRPHEHNPPAEFTITSCEVIDRALAATEPKR